MKTFEEVYATLPSTGWLTEDEARLLWRCCELTKEPRLEVGVYHGRSTALLAEHGELVCVDPFCGFDSDDVSGEKTRLAFIKNMLDRDLDPLLYKMSVEEWELRPERSRDFDLCYLDGDHTYEGTLTQVRIAITCKPTIIAIHDVNDDGGGAEVKRAAVSMLGPWNVRVGRLAAWGHVL